MRTNLSKKNRKQETEEVPRREFSWWNIFWLSVLFVLVVTLVILWLLLRGPSQGTIREVSGVSQEQEKIPVPEKRFSGKFLSFQYPGEYSERQSQKDIISLEKANFVLDGNISRGIAVTVRDMSGKTLSDIPEYRIRNDIERHQYEKKKVDIGGQESTVFIRTNEGYEKTAFILENGRLYILSVNMRMFADPEVIEHDFSVIARSIDFFSE